MPNIADLLSRSAAARAEQTAVRVDDAALSYAALDEAAARVAGLLGEHGVGPGDRVGIMLPNVHYFPVCYYGALRAGAAIVPMNPLLKDREVAFYLGDSDAKLIFAWHQFAEPARHGAEQAGAECVVVEPGKLEALLGRYKPVDAVADRERDDTAVILYTSGTTGTPKGAELTHENILRNVEVSVGLFGLGARALTLGALPVFHAFGQTCALNATVCVGGQLTLIPRFDGGRALELIERDRVTLFEGVPTMYAAITVLPCPGEAACIPPRIAAPSSASNINPGLRSACVISWVKASVGRPMAALDALVGCSATPGSNDHDASRTFSGSLTNRSG